MACSKKAIELRHRGLGDAGGGETFTKEHAR
jgi:hypothetical protein